MSLPRYPKYKSSGVEWLGDVPEHWNVVAIKWLSPVQRGASPRPIDDAKYFDVEGDYIWVRIADVSASDGVLRTSEQRLSELGASLSVKLGPGQLFISIAGTVGKPCIAAVNACIHDGFVYFPKLRLPPLFLYRIFETGICYGGLGKFGTQLNLNTDTVGSIRIGVPPPSELWNILTFLDGETAKIDALISEQERLITLLAEKRQATISHAVTKGLNPNAPMRDSGVKWLGAVPEHWGHSKKLVDLAASHRHSFVNGPFGSDLLTSELVSDGVPVVYIRDIKPNGYLRVSQWCVTKKKAQQLEFCNLLPGDIIVAKVGDPPGLAAVYPVGEPEAIVTQDVIRLRIDGEIANAEYVKWLLNSKCGQTQIDSISVEATRTRVGLGDYKQLRFFVPPLLEQCEIAKFLSQESIRLDALSNEATRGIQLLNERRRALIVAAVSGKIDVRQAAQQDQTIQDAA